MIIRDLLLFLSFIFSPVACAGVNTCTVKATGSNATDDTPSILDAFEKCGHGGKVVFENTTYHINSVMNTSSLQDCEIDIQGTLLWGTNISYWLNHSLPVGYQNQSTAWILGGNNIKVNGHGYGTLNGNGDAWYTYIDGVSNYPGRPHALTIANATNLVFEGVRFIRSQMWTLSIIHTQNAVFNSIYVNNTASSGGHGSNTDGADTIYSSHITFRNWTVDNGDDSLSLKANSTDISIYDCKFYNGLGIAIGSIGQYDGAFETVQRLHAKGNTYNNTLHAAYFKTWTGEQVGYPPNGGGGGLGFAADLLFEDMQAANLRSAPFTISQCTTFSGTEGNCTSSKFEIYDISFKSIQGTTEGTTDVASFQCSAVKPCTNLVITDVDLVVASNGTNVNQYLCGNVENPEGWNCTGNVCVGSSATGGC